MMKTKKIAAVAGAAFLALIASGCSEQKPGEGSKPTPAAGPQEGAQQGTGGTAADKPASPNP